MSSKVCCIVKAVVGVMMCLMASSCSDDVGSAYERNDDNILLFLQLRDAAGQSDQYVFFTDPHYISDGGTLKNWQPQMHKCLGYVREVYDKSQAAFMVNGGDWLNKGDTQNEACNKLQYTNTVLRSLFPCYYPVLGNHDTNYQGFADEFSRMAGKTNGTLPRKSLADILFAEYGQMYYSFKSSNATYYVLDTGVEWQEDMDDYRWGQLEWLANSLLADDAQHNTIVQHIVVNNYQFTAFVLNEGQIISAYNAREQLTLGNGRHYDFAQCTGHVDYIMAGHTHYDAMVYVGGVPAIITATANGDVETFDLVMANYARHCVYCIRMGRGANRVFAI